MNQRLLPADHARGTQGALCGRAVRRMARDIPIDDVGAIFERLNTYIYMGNDVIKLARQRSILSVRTNLYAK